MQVQEFEVANDVVAHIYSVEITGVDYKVFFVPTTFHYVEGSEERDFYAEELGFPVADDCYEVKFDLESNVEQNIQFEPPSVGWNINMYELGSVVSAVIDDHCNRFSAKAYTAMAADPRLVKYYKRLAKWHAPRLKFKYVQNLGKEGLHYAFIKEN